MAALDVTDGRLQLSALYGHGHDLVHVVPLARLDDCLRVDQVARMLHALAAHEQVRSEFLDVIPDARLERGLGGR